MIDRFLKTTMLAAMFCAAPVCATAQVWSDLSDQNLTSPLVEKPISDASTSMKWARKVDTSIDDLKFILSKAPMSDSGLQIL